MVNLPISDYIKNYYRKHNVVLDDFTQAVIIASEPQKWLDWSKKLSILREIAENTEDEGLKLQIRDHIAYKLREKAWFMDNQSGRYGYSCTFGVFTTFDEAIECEKQNGESEIEIIKYDKSLKGLVPFEATIAAQGIWDKDGTTIFQLWSYTLEESPKDTYGKKKRFDENIVIPCVYPFDRGDIVRDIRTGEIGVLQTSREDWECLIRRTETDEYQTVLCNNVKVRTVSTYNGPHLVDSSIYLLHLEKIAETQCGIDKNILRCIFRTMDENIMITDCLSDTDAERKIGLWFYYGDGVPQNDEIAFNWLRFAAGNHDNEARYWVGKLYAEGRGVTQNFAKALDWYLAAARHGHVEAQFEVGKYFEDGIGVPPKHKKAVEWFKKAADQGHAEACRRLQGIGECT